RLGNTDLAQRTKSLAVARKVEGYDRDVFAGDVTPDVELRPLEEGMHAQMPAGRYDRVELIPELGRLIAKVPASIRVAGTEDTFLGSYRLLVAPYPGAQAVKSVILQTLFQAFAFSGSKARRGRQCFVGATDIRATIRDEV